MLVTCNNKYQYWCPHGTKNCVCNMYEERDYVADESFEFTCTDTNDDQRDCHLVLIPETNIELYAKKNNGHALFWSRNTRCVQKNKHRV